MAHGVAVGVGYVVGKVRDRSGKGRGRRVRSGARAGWRRARWGRGHGPPSGTPCGPVGPSPGRLTRAVWRPGQVGMTVVAPNPGVGRALLPTWIVGSPSPRHSCPAQSGPWPPSVCRCISREMSFAVTIPTRWPPSTTRMRMPVPERSLSSASLRRSLGAATAHCDSGIATSRTRSASRRARGIRASPRI